MLSSTVKSLALVAGTATLVLGSVSSARAVTVFTDRTAWQAAVNALNGVTTTDTFSDPIAKAQTITLDSGIVSTNSNPPDITAIVFNNNAVVGGQYLNATGSAPITTASETITWIFPKPVFAFGADFFRASVNSLTLTGNFDGTGDISYVINAELGSNTGFFGVIGNANFSSIAFTNGNTASSDVDSFDIDNASFASTPEPGTLMALGILGGGLLLSRRNKRG